VRTLRPFLAGPEAAHGLRELQEPVLERQAGLGAAGPSEGEALSDSGEPVGEQAEKALSEPARCACPSTDGGNCAAIRFGSEVWEREPEPCECVCHDGPEDEDDWCTFVCDVCGGEGETCSCYCHKREAPRA
jgi:hypothetical protein